jgi:hypothetical protein
VVESTLYWKAADSLAEARYLVAFINSEAARARIEKHQSRGQWGARHFARTFFHLPFPRFDRKNQTHLRLAACARRAESIAGKVKVEKSRHFPTVRRRIRKALIESGIAAEINALVENLLKKHSAKR